MSMQQPTMGFGYGPAPQPAPGKRFCPKPQGPRYQPPVQPPVSPPVYPPAKPSTSGITNINNNTNTNVIVLVLGELLSKLIGGGKPPVEPKPEEPCNVCDEPIVYDPATLFAPAEDTVINSNSNDDLNSLLLGLLPSLINSDAIGGGGGGI